MRSLHAVDAGRLRALLGARAVVVVALDDGRRLSAVADCATLGDTAALERWARSLVLLPTGRRLMHGEQLARRIVAASGERLSASVLIARRDVQIDLGAPRPVIAVAGRPLDLERAGSFREALADPDPRVTLIRLSLERLPP